MNPFTATLPRLILGCALVAACSPELPTEAAIPGPVTARGGNPPPAYTSVDLGSLLGSESSHANDVNDAGDITGGNSTGAFAVVGGSLIRLPGDARMALAISNGSPLHVVGWAGSPSQPARWTITNGESSAPTMLALGDTTWGSAIGVNDAGAAVGHLGSRAAMWNPDGSLALTFVPQGFVRGEGRDINSAGHAIFVFYEAGISWQSVTGYLRLASGQLIPLPPLGNDAGSYVNGISEVVNNSIHIAGTSQATQETSRGVRWTIDVTTGTVSQIAVRPENTHALSVSNAGAVAGFIEPPLHTLKFKGFLWRGTEFLTLSPPKGAKDPRAWAISPSGEYIAGEGFVGTRSHALRWRVFVP